jgi:hypothetical protein
MADYYPLLAKALAGLPNNSTQNSRQAIYDRARKALIGQLRSMRPPLPEEDIAREDAALDSAISRLESERLAAAPAPGAAPVSGDAPPRAAASTTVPISPVPQKSPAPAAAKPGSPAPAKPPAGPAPSQSGAPRAAGGGAPAPAPGLAGRALAPPGAPRYAPPSRPPSPPAAPSAPQRSAVAPPAATTPPVSVEAASQGAGSLERSASPPVLGPAYAAGEAGRAPAVAVAPPKANGESGRPAAPGPAQPRQRRLWPWVALVGLVVAICAVAGFALVQKEKPQDLAIKDTVAAPAKASGPQNKIVDRVQATNEASDSAAPAPTTATPGAAPPPASPDSPAATTAAAAPASAATSQPAPAPAASPSPPATAGETPIPTVTVPTVPVHPSEASPAGAQIAAAQPAAATAPGRAALLIDAGDPQKPKIDLGTAVWSLIPAATGPAQAAGPTVQAEIEIPDLKLHATVTIRKNTDASLPATHTMDLRFTFADGAEVKGFKDMALPQMRRDDTPNGDPISGVRVKISDAYFLVGLTRSDADLAHNLDLLNSRNWLDFPLLFNDDHVAKLTFEKGPVGQSVIAQAVAAWK